MESTQQNIPPGSEVRVVSASVIAHLQAQGLQVRSFQKIKKKRFLDSIKIMNVVFYTHTHTIYYCCHLLFILPLQLNVSFLVD